MKQVSSKKGAQQLAERFYTKGVKYIVFSPGSRNAPLVLTFGEDQRFQCFVIPDERSAAFYALGMAERSKSPVAIMCSSGSAVLNYYPAISEAYYRNIPLIVVTADRPNEWIDQGDGQTIRQQNVYKNHVLGYAELIENPTNKNQMWYNQRSLDDILVKLNTQGGGPIHINFPFSEPLYDLEELKEQNKLAFEWLELERRLSDDQIKDLKRIWNTSARKLILCGQMPKNARINEQLRELAQDKAVAVVVENTSNVQDRDLVHCIDRTITSFLDDAPEIYQPDLLITVGGAIVSKKIKSYLRKFQPKHHWKIGKAFPLMDTYQRLTKSIPLETRDFLNVLLKEGFERHTSRYGAQWKQMDYLTRGKHFDFIDNAPYSDLTVFNLLLDAIPESSVLHLSNSSVIRYAQLFDPLKSITYYCNRGTSGIDGATSTAIGNAIVSKEGLHTLITGDISFFYDSNAFWNNYVPSYFRVFLINNGGGGIFSIIDGSRNTSFKEKFFVAKHDFSAKALCEAFKLNYYSAVSLLEINNQLDAFYAIQEDDRPAVMEIFTSEEESAKILAEYFEAIKVVGIPELKD